MRPAAEFLADVVSDASDVSSLRAADAKLPNWFFVIRKTKTVDANEARFAFNFNSFARHFVERNSANFDRGNHGRHLHLIALKSRGGFVQSVQRHRWDGQGSDEFAISVVARGGFAKFHCAFIDFVAAHEFFGKLGSFSENNDEKACRVWIECSAMANFFYLKFSTNRIDDIVRGWATGFVDEDGTVERIKSIHEINGLNRELF